MFAAIAAAGAILALVIDPAFAHHPTGGVTPTTVWHGLLSGLGHPVIGLDHFAFLVGAGLIASRFRSGLSMLVAFLITGALGAWLHWNGITVPGVELAVALSVVVLGAVLLFGSQLPQIAVLGLFALAGLFHGHALFESIIGAEMGPLGAYLAGMVVSQSGVAIAAMLAMRWIMQRYKDTAPLLHRGAGLVLATCGAVLAFNAA